MINKELIKKLNAIHSAMDTGLGDSDPTHIENDRDLKREYPLYWAAMKLATLIQALESEPELKPVAWRAWAKTVPGKRWPADQWVYWDSADGEPDTIKDDPEFERLHALYSFEPKSPLTPKNP